MSRYDEMREALILAEMPQPRRWRAWWRVFGVILAAMRLLPIPEWRREQWSYRLDIWGMDHFGRSSMTPLVRTCDHPLSRVVWRGGTDVWCWVCRIIDDEPRLLSEPEARLVIERFRALERNLPPLANLLHHPYQEEE